MKIEAATRLKETAGWFYVTTDAEKEAFLRDNPNNVEGSVHTAGWFESLSDLAKKAYLKMHPNSHQGKKAPDPIGGEQALRHAHAEARKHAQKLHDALKHGGTDAQWRAYDAAQAKLSTLTKKLKQARSK